MERTLYAAGTLGEVYLLQGKVGEAAAQYQKVIDNNPNAAGDLKATGEQAERMLLEHSKSSLPKKP